MNLIVNASLSENPTEKLFFRHVIAVAHCDLSYSCLIETEQEIKDLYYQFLLRQGLMDFVEAIVIPSEKEKGLRLDSKSNEKPTLQVNAIRADNYINIIEHLRLR
jgi:hypothetical protein